jgi:alcohol dehydrogenase class IV
MPNVGISQPQRIGIGPGSANTCADEFAARQVHRVFLLTSPSVAPHAKPIVEEMMSKGIVITTTTDIKPAPGLAETEQIINAARAFQPDGIIGFGGGSVLQMAKLAACLCDRPEPISTFFGSDLLPRRRIALACVPTTFGTGCESSSLAYLSGEEDLNDRIISSPWLAPDLAFFDPLFLHSLSATDVLALGIQALGHCIETIVCTPSDSLSAPHAREALVLLSRHLRDAVNGERAGVARTQISLAGACVALCRANAETSALQLLAGPLARQCGLPRTVAAALLTAPLFRTWQTSKIAEFSEVAALVAGEPRRGCATVAEEALGWLEVLIREARPTLTSKIGSIKEEDLAALAMSAASNTRLQRNATKKYSVAALQKIYQQALSPGTGS